MNASVTPYTEFLARRQVREDEKKLDFLLSTKTEQRTEEEEMDILAASLELLCEPIHHHPGSISAQFSITRETWETNPLSSIFQNTAEGIGYDIEEYPFGNIINIIVRKEYNPQKREGA